MTEDRLVPESDRPVAASHPEQSSGKTAAQSTGTSGRIAANTAALVAGQAIQLPVSFLASILIVRALGSEGYGSFVFVYAFFGLFDWLAGFGVETIAVREAAQIRGALERSAQLEVETDGTVSSAKPYLQVSKEGTVWGSAVALSTITSSVAAAAATAAAILLGYGPSWGMLLVLGGVEGIGIVAPRAVAAILQVRLQQWKAAIVTSARHLVWLGAVAALAHWKAPLVALVFTRSALAVIETAVVTALGIRALGEPLGFDKRVVGYLAREAWPVALMYLAIGVYHRIDRVLLQRMVGVSELGYYAVADNIGGLLTILPLAFSRSLYPELCKRVASQERFDAALERGFRVGMAAIGTAIVVLLALASPAIELAYGPDFERSARLLAVLLIGYFGATYGTLLGAALLARSLQRTMTVATVVGAATNLGLNLLLIPKWQGFGAAWATAISYVLSGSLIYELTGPTRHLNRLGLKAVAPSMAALLIGAGLTLLLRPRPASMIVGPLATVSVLWLAGALKVADFGFVADLVARRPKGSPSEGSLSEKEDAGSEVAKASSNAAPKEE